MVYRWIQIPTVNLRPAVTGLERHGAAGHIIATLGCWVGHHPATVTTFRKIVVAQKKNKMPERFVHGKSVCVRCGRVASEAYLNMGVKP